VKIVDTHQHLWDLNRFPYSWCAGVPQLNRSFLPEDYASAAAEVTGMDVVASVHVEADVDDPYQLDETRWIASLTGSTPIKGLVASCRPERDDFKAQLEALVEFGPVVKGVRRVLHTQPDELSQTPLFAQNVRLLSEFGFSFDLCVLARQLPIGLQLVRACPNVSFILDHCGVPDIAGGALDPWREHIGAMSALPNVTCKLSGLVAYTAAPEPTTDELRPYVEHVFDCFGPERIVWGSDWPVCTLATSFAGWVERAIELTRGLNPDEQEAVFRLNALRVYRLENVEA
jgi:predicted TIM-barrel fold metal-dependent hydrolase